MISTHEQRKKADEVNDLFRKIIKQYRDGYYAHVSQNRPEERARWTASQIKDDFARALKLMPPEFNTNSTLRIELAPLVTETDGLSFEDAMLLWLGWYLAVLVLEDEKR